MKLLFNYIRSIFVTNLLFYTISIIIVLFIVGFFFTLFFIIATIALYVLISIIILDLLVLYIYNGIQVNRTMESKLSNGDENTITITIENSYSFPVHISLIDEIPFQFQQRNFNMKFFLLPKKSVTATYQLRPVTRGEYNFGGLNVYVSSPIFLIKRRYQFAKNITVPVYPSIVQLRKYDFYAISNRLNEIGVKKMRRYGASMEFDQIRNYIIGDDYRKLNWKATARKNELMINQYKDERSQNIYSVIDMGRVMKMPFNGMTLLDYAINASLVISNIAIRKDDKAGIITFSKNIESLIPAKNKYTQMREILETLYAVETDFNESSYESLYYEVSKKISQRSLLLFFTNFETYSGMERQLPYLQLLAKKHVVVVIFFYNTELKEFLQNKIQNTEDIYVRAIAEKFSLEKYLIVKELKQAGIASILTTPEDLTVKTINKYLELKSRGVL